MMLSPQTRAVSVADPPIPLQTPLSSCVAHQRPLRRLACPPGAVCGRRPAGATAPLAPDPPAGLPHPPSRPAAAPAPPEFLPIPHHVLPCTAVHCCPVPPPPPARRRGSVKATPCPARDRSRG
eukprot:Tamp_11702.p2 GENE.Tamp_11702~~Tamp_11702.p2  ORF type:complete len:123 (+),score=4.40 Tamp_11702:1350-1718(+)